MKYNLKDTVKLHSVMCVNGFQVLRGGFLQNDLGYFP